jgi:hypothetical protein
VDVNDASKNKSNVELGKVLVITFINIIFRHLVGVTTA